MSANEISRMSDMELRRMGVDELIRRLRHCDQERMNALREHKNLMGEMNRRMQVHLLEIRGLKEVNQRLQDDSQELRDLCCFLDDDRQKGRKLAREWQRFGRYTSSVMKSEVSTYQDKLKELESRQEDLVKENLDLKELCLYLDQESQGSSDRDQGDGSSNTTPTEENNIAEVGDSAVPKPELTDLANGGGMNDETLRYIRELEDRITHLVDSQDTEPTNMPANTTEFRSKFFSTPKAPSRSESRTQHTAVPNQDGLRNVPGAEGQVPPNTSKPEAVVHAMKVLEVHEQLERPLHEVTDDGELDENEKAIVREMCNVVWRKLGDYVPGYK